MREGIIGLLVTAIYADRLALNLTTIMEILILLRKYTTAPQYKYSLLYFLCHFLTSAALYYESSM